MELLLIKMEIFMILGSDQMLKYFQNKAKQLQSMRLAKTIGDYSE